MIRTLQFFSIVGGLLVFLYFVYDALHIRINHSISMPLGIYTLNPGAFPTHQGQLVYFCPNAIAKAYLETYHPEADTRGGQDCPDGSAAMVKTAIALPGDSVRFDDNGVSVNAARYLIGSKPLRRIGDSLADAHPLPYLKRGVYRIRPGMVWAYTPEWVSFDSRYVGPLAVMGTATPIFIYQQARDSEPPAAVMAMQR